MKKINPKTGNPYSRHDIRDKDGKLFFAYTNILKLDGYFKEIWLSPDAMARQVTNNTEIKRNTYVRRSDRVPPKTLKYFKANPKSKADYKKLVKALRQDSSLTRGELLELLDSGDETVLNFIRLTIPG